MINLNEQMNTKGMTTSYKDNANHEKNAFDCYFNFNGVLQLARCGRLMQHSDWDCNAVRVISATTF